MEREHGTGSLLRRRTTRRSILGTSLAAGSLAVAYAALGDPLDLFSSRGAGIDPELAAISRESVRVSHLLRRASFGVTRDEYEHFQTQGLQATLDELINFSAIDDDDAIALAAAVPTENRPALPLWWLVRMANTRRPLQEKMAFFWHGLLTSQVSQVRDNQAMIAQNEFLRAHAMDAFPTILRGISADPAMMVYLDIDNSQRSAPNENYARELMELFSMGVGNYTEQDVREAARAFTGWQVQRSRDANGQPVLGEALFRPQRFDNGTKTFLGRTGNFRPDDIVDIIIEQPATGQYITRRLFSYFVYPDPAAADIEPFVAVYEQSGRSIGAVVDALLRSEVFYSPRAYRSLVKSPVEYTVGAIKALGLHDNLSQYAFGGPQPRDGGSLGLMGQVPFEPPNVAGWPGGAMWLNSATLYARLNFINQITGGSPPRGNPRAQQPAVPLPASGPLGTAAEALGHYLPLLLDDNISAEARQTLLDFAGGADVQLEPEQLRGLVYLLLASPQFHLS